MAVHRRLLFALLFAAFALPLSFLRVAAFDGSAAANDAVVDPAVEEQAVEEQAGISGQTREQQMEEDVLQLESRAAPAAAPKKTVSHAVPVSLGLLTLNLVFAWLIMRMLLENKAKEDVEEASQAVECKDGVCARN
ncbi:hypothetical protein Efla_002613 [Eimeria flavescens]